MLSMGDYPPGVNDAMIEKYFGDDGACCENCYYYSCGTCSKKEDELEDMSEEEYSELGEKEIAEYSVVDADDYCDAFELKDDDEEPYDEPCDRMEDWE